MTRDSSINSVGAGYSAQINVHAGALEGLRGWQKDQGSLTNRELLTGEGDSVRLEEHSLQEKEAASLWALRALPSVSTKQSHPCPRCKKE